MKERGLLMTPVNYTRCKDGSKTQTRRIIKPEWWRCLDPEDEDDRAKAIKQCPYGTVGDRLYVKEGLELHGERHIQYRRDKTPLAWFDGTIQASWEWQRDTLSPLHMPKWAARLWLELTDVRIERLHEISAADVRAEGVEVREFQLFGADSAQRTHIHRLHFKQLWESNAIHKPGSWDLNPWLWCLTFKKVRD